MGYACSNRFAGDTAVRVAGFLPHRQRNHAACCRLRGGRRVREYGFSSGKTGFDFSAGGALADQLRHAAPEDVPRIVDEYFGNAAEEDMKSVLYRYYLLMDLLVSAARLAAEVQPDSIAAPDDPQAVLAQATTLEGAKACAAQTLRRLTRLCYRHQNVRYSEEIGRAKTFIRANYSDSGLSLHMVAAEVGFSPNHFSTIFSQRRRGRPLSNI